MLNIYSVSVHVYAAAPPVTLKLCSFVRRKKGGMKRQEKAEDSAVSQLWRMCFSETRRWCSNQRVTEHVSGVRQSLTEQSVLARSAESAAALSLLPLPAAAVCSCESLTWIRM